MFILSRDAKGADISIGNKRGCTTTKQQPSVSLATTLLDNSTPDPNFISSIFVVFVV